MAASNTRFTQNSLGQSKNPIDSDHGIYRYLGGWPPLRHLGAKVLAGREPPANGEPSMNEITTVG